MTATTPAESAVPGVRPRNTLIAVSTAAMAFPMIIVFLVGALGPAIVADIDVSRSALGTLTATTMGLAAVMSLWAGQIVDHIGPRRALLLLFAIVAVAFGVISLSAGFALLLLGVALASPAQALANPATNKLISEHLVAVRATAVGIKQSGVQLAALAAGAGLAPLVPTLGWRGTVMLLIPLSTAVLVVTALSVPGPAQPPKTGRLVLPGTPGPALRWVMLTQFCIGFGLAAVATFLPLYATTDLGFSGPTAGVLLAVFAVAGVASRIVWNRIADRRGQVIEVLALVCGLSAAGPVMLIAADPLSPVLAWVGATWIGATATAANAVAMLLAVGERKLGSVGKASGLASVGFFGGFALGPPLVGAFADTAWGFTATWTSCVVAMAVSTTGALRARSVLRRGSTNGESR